MSRSRAALAALALSLAVPAAAADLTVGFSICATGPAASLGIPTRNTVALLPATIAGLKVNYVVLDDATDPTTAVKNARKLTSESAVDVVVGSNSTPASLAMIDVVAESGTPMISLAAGKAIIAPMDAKRRWIFKAPQNDELMAGAVVEHMVSKGVKRAAFIGFSDAYGEGWWNEFSKAAQGAGIQIVANERFARPDTSVSGQILKIVAAGPDAVLVGASGTPAALPQKTLVERGYKGLVYHTHGVATADFLRVGGKDVEGAFLPLGPAVVAAQLPADHPSKAVSLDFIGRYEKAHGAGSFSAFASHAWDAGLLLQAAVPVALARAKPGTKEFREALRTALEQVHGLKATQGVYDLSAENHQGLDRRARVMAQIQGGTWKLAK
jgi:branched-chain amino acid transport system substrate-binding protein